MTAFKHILVPTDFGEAAAAALDYAITLASKFDAKITLVHASWIPPSAYAAYAQGLYWPTEELAESAKKELDGLLKTAKTRYPKVEGLIVSAEPWPAILRLAKERDVDLIVMGTHGRRGLARLFLGSVAEKIVRLSPKPVLTISSKAGEVAREEVLDKTADAAE